MSYLCADSAQSLFLLQSSPDGMQNVRWLWRIDPHQALPEPPKPADLPLQELQQLGWIIGRNLRVDYRWGGGNADVIRKHATESAALAPDVILAHGVSTVGALLQAT